MKKPSFLSVMVIFSLVLCALYGAIAIIFQYKTGMEISSTLTENWFQVFGIEIIGTAAIYIVKRITSIEKIKDKIQLKKENNIEITEKDFNEEENSVIDFAKDEPIIEQSEDIYG